MREFSGVFIFLILSILFSVVIGQIINIKKTNKEIAKEELTSYYIEKNDVFKKIFIIAISLLYFAQLILLLPYSLVFVKLSSYAFFQVLIFIIMLVFSFIYLFKKDNKENIE